MLLLVTAVLTLAMVSYLLLASTLFTRDKRAFIFDLNASVAQTMAEEVSAAIASVADKLAFAGTDKTTTLRLFAGEPELLEVSVYVNKVLVQQTRDDKRLASLNITPDDLEAAHKTHPLDFDATAATGRFVGNASVPPDVSLLWIAIKDGDRVIAALLRPDRLSRIFAQSASYTAFLVDARGQIVVHPEAARVVRHENMRHLQGLEQALTQKGSRAIVQANGDVIGAYARVKSPTLVVVTETAEREAFNASRELIKRSALFAVGIVLLSTLASIFFARRLTSPLKRLSEAMSDVGRGELNVKVQVESSDEVGVLAKAFNTMASALQDRDKKIEQTRAQLIQSEKLAALGALSAEISHEIKNPLTTVLGFAQLAQRTTDPAELKDQLQTIEKQTKRVRELLDNTLKFTRLEHGQNEIVNVNEVVSDTLKMVRHQLAYGNIKVISVAADSATVTGNAGQLQQVLLNLVMNAQHAMKDGGTLTVRSEVKGDQVLVHVSDTGTGMEADTKAQLFKPFFTTKPKGQGTGLGLSVSQTIIEQHKGTIAVESALGQGTTFTLTLPAA